MGKQKIRWGSLAVSAALLFGPVFSVRAEEALPPTAPIDLEEAAPPAPPVAESVQEPVAPSEPLPPAAPEAPALAKVPAPAEVVATPPPVEAPAPPASAVATRPAQADSGDMDAPSLARSFEIDPRVPIYQRSRPMWSIEVSGSSRGVGTSSVVPGLNGATMRGLQLSFDFQPPWTQSLGILSLGPTLTLYPIFEAQQEVTATKAGIWGPGAQFRYQFHYFREQPVVPYVGYEMQWLPYALTEGGTGRLNVKGSILGVALLLNWMDPGAAAEFYVNYGVSRTYLVAELHDVAGEDDRFLFSGTSSFFGLRFEF